MDARIIKKRDCKICEPWLKVLDRQDFPYIIYDADDSTNQQQLDDWRITNMPVLQLIEGTEVLYQFPPGRYSVRLIKAKMEELKDKKK